MGYQLLTEALSAAYAEALIDGRPLPDHQWRVLLVMAHRAVDRDGLKRPARVYCNGWQTLAAEALNYTGEWGPQSAGYRATARAIKGLTERGLIRRLPDRIGGHGAYEILPKPGS